MRGALLAGAAGVVGGMVSLLTGVVVCSVASASVSAASAPPATEARPVTDVVHGRTLVDPYRWLEGDNSDPANMGRMNDEVASWTDAQNAYTRSVLDGLPGRAEVEARIAELLSVGVVSAPTARGDRYFFSKREGDQSQALIYVRERDQVADDGWVDRVLLDPMVIDPSGLTTISWTSPSEDGSMLAFGWYRAGDENSTLHVLEVASGSRLPVEIGGKVSGCSWLPDGSGFIYRALADVTDPYSGVVRFHALGTDPSHDPTIIAQRDLSTIFSGEYSAERLEELQTTYGPFGSLSRDGRWLMMGYYTGTASNDLWAVDFEEWRRTGGPFVALKRPIMVDRPARSFGDVVGDALFLHTNWEAPKGRVVAVDLTGSSGSTDDPSVWRTIAPERHDAVLGGINIAQGLIGLEYLRNASSEIVLRSFDGGEIGMLDLPGIGSASLTTFEDRTEAYLTFSSYNMPRSIYRVDLVSGERTLWDRPDVSVDPDSVVVEQKWYTTRDGTRVSMFIIRPRDMEYNGDNPTILYGYGGFNISMRPGFSSTLFPWFERGGVYAVANIRGGGEYGREWHEAGMLGNKQNVYDDFIAAAEFLIEQGYTRPERLGIAGGSNGGLLTGAVVAQRPELFRAAFVGVPLLDMVRYHLFLMARYWVPEYGSADVAEQFEFIAAYSPYHNISEGVAYPAMFITAGENDMRVHPLHARKFAALMQSATASDPSDRPVLLWVDREAGHGGGKPLWMRVRDTVDQRMFFMWQLGMLGDGDGAWEGDSESVGAGADSVFSE